MKKMLLTLAALFAAATSALADLYVTPTGAGAKDGSSWANAFAGIQAAVDAVDAAVAADANYAIPTIRVADGTYTRGVVSRNMALDVRSENGAAATIIDGFNTNRCVLCYANGFKTTPTFTGFTLRNGNVTGFSGTDSWGGGAGGGTLVDCVIEDCAAAWGGGTYRANTQRCIIRRCRATSAGGACAEEGTHRNTLMCQSTGTSYIIYDVTLYNCTVADNAATSDNAINIRNKYNCIVWGNTINGQPSAQNDPQNPKFAGDGDYRLRVGSPGIDGGDATYSTEGYVGLTDLAGNARVQGNAIDLGCYEGTGVEGCLVTAVAGGNGVVSPTSFFTNETMSVTITADTSVYGRPVTAWYTNGVLAASGGNSLTVVMSGNGDIEVTAMFATYEWFVNGTTGSDSNDGSSAATAFKTIAKAVSSAANDETINVAPGTYAPIDTTGVRVNILGTAGAAATIIDGGDTQRCALLSDGTTLTGFTLQHGRSITSDDMQGGGGAMGGTLVACVLKDNIASYGGGALGSTLIRCTVTDNSAAFGGGVHRCQSYNSLIAYNSATEGGGARFGELRGCTVVYNRGCLSGGIEYAMVLNSILRYNRTANGRASYNLWNYEGNCIDEPNPNGEDGEWLDGYTIVEDPLFVDPENGDFRLLAGSPCINYGDVNFYYVDDGLDLAGNPRIVDGDPDLGCYEGEVEGHVVSVRVDGHGSVSARTIVVAEGGSATITATADGRAFLRWLVDGENAGTSTTLTLSNIDADHVVTACFQRNTTTVSGSGAALQNAINAAKDGDTLVVSPGTYSAIVATNRVLDIKSSAGPETTIIQGTNNGLLSGTRAATFSLTVTRPTCTLSGFTLTGGFCGDPIYGGGGVFGGIVSNCVIRGNGALIGGGAAYSMLSHCVISNNTAYVLGGGAAFLALDNCLVTGNEVQFNTIEWVSRLAATLGINLNIPADFGGGAGVAYAAADHCTITKNTATAAEAGGGFWVVLDNSIVAGNTATAEGANQNLFNTPVVPLYTCSTYDEFWGDGAPGFVNATMDDTFVDAAGGDFRLKATSACVDGCDSTFDLENPDPERIALWLGATDLTGSPRWLALAPDIGCYETTPATPGAVQDVAATRSSAREDVRVTWTGAKHGSWYTIHRGPWNNGAGTFAQAEQIGVVTNVFTWFVDDTAEASVDYRYWVVAHSGAGAGPYGAGDRGYWVAPLVITTESLPDGTVREPWSAQLAATGGIGTYTWEVTQPDWLSFSGATLSGVPRVQGDVWVVVTVMDQRGTEAQKAFQISIAKNPNPQNITISNLAEFRTFMEDVHTYYFEGDTVTLTADIDCEGGRFTTGASGSSAYSCFKGTFDGQGHVISNFLNKALSAGTGNTSTFGVAMFDIARDGAVIKNLTLQGDFGNGAATPDYAAAFAAYAIGHTNGTLGLTLENCHFIGSVTNYKCSAAFVGAALHGSGAPDGRVLYMTNCTARGSIVSTYIYVTGGLVASGEGVEAYDCSMEGEVRGRWTLGGLIGQAFDSSFARCSFAGSLGPGPDSINGSDGGCGGLVGLASNAVFRACSANADIDWNISSGYNAGTGRINSRNFIGEGGAAGVTCGSSAFYDCTAAGTLKAKNGYGGGFVGWTAGAEVFSNCTTTVTLQPDARYVNTIGHGGFASSVASAGALFVDCSVSPRGNNIFGGFYNNQHPRAGVAVGTNTFRRCTVENPADVTYGFASACWNGVFEGCTVRGGRAGTAGFVGSAGKRPDDSNSSTYPYAQTSTFTDCSVHGTRACHGFVQSANSDGKAGSTNVFRRCRAGCLYGTSNLSGASDSGFGYTLNKGTLVEDCAAYGIADMGDFNGGFASDVSLGTTIRRSVAAVIPRTTDNRTAGFVDNLSSGAVVEDCYAVCGPVSPAVYGDGYYDYQNGYQGGFVRRCRIGQTEGSSPIRRSFALWPVPATTCPYVGSFAAVTPYSDYSTDYFEDCYRPEESPIGDCNNADAEGVEALTAAQFASASAATMPNYDFQNVWHAPNGLASSPYLDASVDADTNFWFFAGIIGAEGRVLVNGEAPREAYPAGSVLTVQAVADNPDLPFAGWVGDGFADPSAQTTTYTVKNVSAIAAEFCIPIYTVDDWTNMVHASYESSVTDTYALMNDLDFTDYIATNGWNYVDGYYAFAGKLFGQGHTIRGLVTTKGSFNTTQALFSSLANGAEIRDLTIEFSNVPGDQNTLSLAGLAASVGSGCLISNCHVKADWQGVYPDVYVSPAYKSCQYYGLAQTVSGVGIRIVDCTVEGKLAGGTSAYGFVGSATLNGGEIARCAVFADVSTLTNRTDGAAAGFAGEITLSGGAVVRECFSAGSVDAAADAAGFACRIDLRDDQSQVRDCYSTAEVIGGENQNPAGFVCRISDINDEGGVLPVANCWFGGTARVRGRASQYYQPYGFAHYLDGDASLENCAWIEVPGAKEAGTAGVTAIPQAASRKTASWPGFDFAGTWSLSEDETTPYFAWSLAEGTDFRLFAVQEEGKTITIPETATPGSTNAISAVATDDSFFCGWAGAGAYASASENPTTLLADNHRTARCVWGIAITNRAGLAAVASNPTGIYGLGADIDLGGEPWSPLCQGEYTPFTGTIYGNGHTISNLTVETSDARAGLFGGLGAGATITDLHLANPVVRGANCVGTLAGYVEGATIGGCTVSGADVTATSERAGCFVGQIVGDTSVSRCSVIGDIAGSDRYVGGFVGSAEGSAAIEKCYALGSVKGTGGEGFGGFVGYAAGDSVSISECFACGAVAASGRNSVGGFAGYIYDSPAFSDCYALADVAGGSYVGGFAGQLYYSYTAFARCYAAGTTVGSSEVGGFAGRQYRGGPTFADCFRIADGLADVGAADLVGIDALSAAAMHSRSSFAAFHATGKWTQTDGLTQPYFAWSLVDGKFLLSGDAATVNGLGAYAPGAQAPISANAQGRFFISWTGGATYADASASSTTVLLDNFRVVDYLAGASISTRAELAAIADDPAGTYGLAADIDLGGADWTPIATFTGKLYGRGHVISNLTVTGSSNYAGLFAYVSGEVSGLTLLNPVVSGGDHTGAFAGCVNAGATVNRCAVIGGRVTASGNYSGVFAGSIEGAASVGECFAVGTIASTASYVGGFSGYVGQNNTSVSDCYAVSDATGSQRVGSFTGHAETSSCSIRRCYAAGTASGSSDAGGFAGYVSSSPVIADCFAQTPSAAMTGVTVLDAAGMRAASNFAAFLASGAWSQIDGKTQPYFAWGLVDGGFLLSGDAATITGLGACAPGTQAPISIDPTGGIFLGWTGGATYADASASATTVLADNYRTVSASLGTLITTRAELEAISSNPAGYYGLGADIDLSGAPWTPLGSSSQPFTGTLYGRGYKITGLAFDNTSSGDANGSRAGLFRYVRDATIDGIHLEGVSISGYERCGALAGEVQGATTIRNCSAQGSVSGNYNYIGLLAGYISGSGVLFEGCATTGSVSAVQSDAGGFAGIVYGGAATFIDCHASAAVSSAGSGTSRGGFLSALYSGSGSSSFTRCTVEGSVSASGNSYVGGFISYVGRPGTFTDCSANVRVSGGQHTGGFAGRICDGANGSTFLRCTAGGDVSATSDSAGGFVGTCEKNATFTECRALGAVSSTSEKAGGFVGNVTTANAFQRCMAAGSVTATKNAGGFVGYNSGSGTTATECFAIGDVTATTTDSDANAGGFLGYGYYGAACTDCYAIGSAKGLRAVGGFAGQVYDAGNVFTRCYAAGALDCTGTYAGAFVGYPRRYGAVTDCRVQFAGVRAAGTSAAGDSAAFDGVTELDSAGMHARSNFAPYHALDPQVWAQIDGATHPYFTWSLSDGRMSLLGATVGASGGAVAGAGWHEPGATVTIRAVESDTAVFVGWTGTTPYANPGAATTTVVLDNFRTVTARFSKLVSTAGQLADLRNDLASDVALGADIDLSALDGGWTPIGDNSAPFTGTFHGKGHTITGLSYENTASAGSYAGLFGAVKDATIEDVHLEGVDLAGYQYTGALVGDVQGRTTIRDCSAEGSVTGANTYTGLLVGRVSGAGTAFENCAATGAVVSAFAETGGLVGGVTATASFADCAASVDVSGTGGNNKGGFVGSVNAADTLFTNCVAVGSANGAGTVGGFVGSSSGSSVQYVDCEAHGPVSGTGDNTGGFAGSSSSGPRFAGCGAFGAVSSSSKYVGGFIGNGSNSAFWRCLAVGSATGSQYVGGFLGYNYSGNLTVAECFALGDVTATTTGSDAFAGGFVGSVSASTSFTDSYCLGTVKGLRKVGGFAGTLNNTGLAFTRCYAAGGLDCSGTYAGAFAGYLQSAATFGDCAVLCAGDLHAVGSSTAGTSDQNASIAEYDAAGMKDSDNFQTWLAIDDADGSVWSQADNLSQPYLAWSAPDGKLVVYPSIVGSGRGEIAGAWTGHNPGTLAQVTAVPQDSFFVEWLGSTPYADRTAATTTIALDNHRVAAMLLGRLIYTADELDAVRNNLGGIYGLGADIDLAGRDWTPIGFNNAKFTGQFHGRGYEIRNLICTNSPSSQYHGLFGFTVGATLDGIVVSGTVKATAYYTGGLVGCADATFITNCHAVVDVSSTSQYTGGLVGAIGNGTVIVDCSAAGTVTSTDQYTGGLAGGSSAATIEIRDSVSTAETVGDSYVGGLVGYVSGGNASVISGCRADGYACCTYHSVGGIVGYVSAPLVISNCVARGDVCCRRGYNYGGYGGFVGYLYNSSAVLSDNWCSGAVWGQGANCGSFVGYSRSGTIRNCSIYAYGAGPRPFCGSDENFSGGSLTASQIDALSADWPAVKQHVDGATPISTAEELLAVTNNLAGIYVLKNDIDLGGATISSIGNASAGFTGEFYGKNHCISNFVVDSSVSGAGLFGCIAGGRVSGVRACGTVTGSNQQVGGFVGRLDSKSLVDGCSFSGTVTGAHPTSYAYAGGFVGMTADSPVALRCCVVNATVTHTGSGSYAYAYTGGFVGSHERGYVMDCYAVADVASVQGQRFVGGFAGNVGSGRITTSWCAGSVEMGGSYKGAFAGYASSGNVTKSYYDSGKTALLAVNNAAYTGITPLTSSEMLHAANFPVFDFDRTWLIDEGATTPYLQTFVVVKRGYDVWLEQNGLPEDTEPNDLVNGIPAGLRYVYSVPNAVTNLNELATPFFRIVTVSGKPRAAFLPTRDGYEGVQVNIQIYATSELTDMVDPDPAHWPHRVNYVYDTYNDVWKPATGLEYPKMFFRWCITFARAEE